MGKNGFEKRDYGQVAIRSDGERGIDYFAEQEKRKKAEKKA